MNALVVLSFDAPTPDALPAILEAINPPHLPHFAGQARITFGHPATIVTTYLDGEVPENIDPQKTGALRVPVVLTVDEWANLIGLAMAVAERFGEATPAHDMGATLASAKRQVEAYLELMEAGA